MNNFVWRQKRLLFNLFSLYYSNEYIKRDVKKAIEYLQKSTNQFYQYALNDLGLFYLFGLDVKRDINKLIYYLTTAENHQISTTHGRFLSKELQSNLTLKEVLNI